MSTPKLPEWPKKPWGSTNENTWAHYYNDTTEAALARMEALVEELRDLAAVALPHKDERRVRIYELLAACERRSEG